MVDLCNLSELKLFNLLAIICMTFFVGHPLQDTDTFCSKKICSRDFIFQGHPREITAQDLFY